MNHLVTRTVGLLLALPLVAWEIGRGTVNRLRALDRRMGSEAWIRSVELQAEDDLATILAIAALEPVEPGTRP